MKEPCYMCNNAKVDDGLTDSCDLSYFGIGNCEKGISMFLRSGDGKPVSIEVNQLIDGIWHLVGVYEPRFCPNCGRILNEYNRKED